MRPGVCTAHPRRFLRNRSPRYISGTVSSVRPATRHPCEPRQPSAAGLACFCTAMPTAPLRPCSHAGCRALVRGGRCEQHAVAREGTFADKQRGSRHQRGYDWRWVKTRARILARDGGVCQCLECKRLERVLPATEVDHIVPKFEGGTDDDSNLQAINEDCHARKTAAEAQRARMHGARKQPPVRPAPRPAAGLGRGGSMSGADTLGTDPQVKFFRAGVSGGGGTR